MTAIAPAGYAARRSAIPVWVPPTVFALGIAGLLLTGRPGAARLAYPAGALIVGLWLFARGIGPYLVFTWTLWAVTSGIRRIVDFQLGGLEPQNPMSLTPFLVSAIGAIAVLVRLPGLARGKLVPWSVAGATIVYGYLVGVLKLGLLPATHALISWLVPLGLGLYCAVEWRRYPETRAAFRQAYLAMAVLLGSYGILQFIDPPAWDRLWMMDSGMYSIGRAFPYEVRVFSLVNAPLAFATMLVAGLIVALSSRGIVRMGVLAVGTVALLLSLVRSVWVAGALGIVVYVASLPLRSIRRVVGSALLTVALVSTAALVAPPSIREPTLNILTRRFATFNDLGQDVSLRDRTRFLDDIGGIVAENPVGQGLGSTGVSSMLAETGSGIRDFDNGVFAVLYSLGWFAGGTLLLAAAVIIGRTVFGRAARTDPMAAAARAVALTSLLLIVGANVMEGVSAAVLWGFAGLATAAERYHRDVDGAP